MGLVPIQVEYTLLELENGFTYVRVIVRVSCIVQGKSPITPATTKHKTQHNYVIECY